jgi:Fe-S oxidoreductase
VVVFPDTFSNRFDTDVGVAAVEAIEAVGWHVVMPNAHLCCGRPLYDYGYLNAAERYLRRVLAVLRDDIRSGTPIVGIEPSCVATFKDELPKLLPNDDDAKRLSKQAYHFAEFFTTFDIDPPELAGEAILWGHCHQKATGGTAPDIELLQPMGLQTEEATGGCCGLAGSWGFEADHHDLSMQIAEHALLPKVRGAGPAQLIVADGFSCRTQVEQGSTRTALHLAQVLQMARENASRPRPAAPLAIKIKRAVALAAFTVATALVARAALGLRAPTRRGA